MPILMYQHRHRSIETSVPRIDLQEESVLRRCRHVIYSNLFERRLRRFEVAEERLAAVVSMQTENYADKAILRPDCCEHGRLEDARVVSSQFKDFGSLSE